MIVGLAISIALSFGTAWLCGAAFVSRPGTALRGRVAVAGLVFGALSFVPLPPQILVLGASVVNVPGADLGVGKMLAFPRGFVAWPWWTLWIIGTIVSTLVGARVWQAGSPGWRAMPGAYDTSPAARARATLLVADDIASVADTIARLGLTAKDAELLAPDLRILGRRLARDLPDNAPALYRQFASRGVPPTVAGPAARFLGEGVREAAVTAESA